MDLNSSETSHSLSDIINGAIHHSYITAYSLIEIWSMLYQNN